MPRRITVIRILSSAGLSKHLISNTDISKVVIFGDWNTTLNPIDKRGGQPWKATSYRNSLKNLMEELNLIDIYRQIHPTTKSFTLRIKTFKFKIKDRFSISIRCESVEYWTDPVEYATELRQLI